MTSNERLMKKFTEAHRLHPAAIVFSFISFIKETIFGFGIGLIITLKESVFYFLIFAGIFLVVIVIYSVLSWWRFTYFVEGDELRIEQGVFIRKKRYLSKHRIHKIDLTANVVHRLFKLVSVQIDTASNSGNAEVRLSAISLRDAAGLRKLLQKQQENDSEETTAETLDTTREKMSWRRLFIAGSTSGSAGVVIIAVLTLFSQFEELIPRQAFNMAFDWFISVGIIVLVFFIVFLAFLLWVFGIAGTMIRYGNFTIEKRENELFIKRGLLETKELTIPYERIQAIGIEQSPIRQPFGFVRIFAVVAGGSFDKLESFPVLFPMMHRREVAEFVEKFLPEYDYSMFDSLQCLPKRSLLFYIGRSFILPFLSFIPIISFIPSLYWISLIVLFFTLLLGWFQYKDLGHTVQGDFFAFQQRRFQKTRIITSKRRIQAFEKSKHKLQAKQGVASMQISLIGMEGLGTHYKLHHLSDDDANEIGTWYSFRPRQSTEPADNPSD